MILTRRLVGASLLVLFLVAGCALFTSKNGAAPIDRYKPLLRVGVSLAVDRLLTQQPELVPMTVQVSTVLVDIFDAGEMTSIAQVGAFIRSKIPWDKLGPETKPLVEALLVGIGEELRVLASRHQIPETHLVLVVKEMLTWVRDIALRHSAVPVRVQRVGT